MVNFLRLYLILRSSGMSPAQRVCRLAAPCGEDLSLPLPPTLPPSTLRCSLIMPAAPTDFVRMPVWSTHRLG
ncbi:hypothetical protein [Microcoleus sp. FACHB-68]|uniref:hypothetical protein n=1 Tax=Microcoleus sp. FACHB-68 TaxID=2692826 RepID=UPI0016872CEF|nr:hypothetical protein [Microcoleus sp. FACHB-68]MBD1936244.1 hypothetical protein [Microcoleus sp. FACHB-68]